MLSLWCVLSRLVAELRDALDSCAERQRQLERSLRVSRRLLRAWYADPGTTRLGLPRTVRTPLRDPGPGDLAQRSLPSCGLSVLPAFPAGSEAAGLPLGQAALGACWARAVPPGRATAALCLRREPAETLAPEPTPGPETNEEAPSAGKPQPPTFSRCRPWPVF